MKARTVVLGFIPVKLLRAIAWFCVGLVAYLTLIPGNLEVRTGLPDQLEHAGAYFVTSILLALSFPRKHWLIAAGLGSYAILLEILQSFSSDRTPRTLDAFSSCSGAILGVIAVGLLSYWLKIGRSQEATRS